MKKRLLSCLPLLLLTALPAAAQENWSIGVGTGPFIFGDFVKRTLLIGNTGPSGRQTATLSAATRAGVSVDVQKMFSDHFGFRAEGTFTRAPLAVKSGDENGVDIPAGKLNVTTFTLPIVWQLNRNGAFRFHLMGGPAYAMYDTSGRTNASGIPVFEGHRNRFGAVAGGGVAWHLSERFAVEANIEDIVTSSPFERSDFPNTPGFSIERPNNIHTTIGIRWGF